MADYLRRTDPQRADLLLRAIRLSREARVSDQMTRVVKLLESEQFGSGRRSARTMCSPTCRRFCGCSKAMGFSMKTAWSRPGSRTCSKDLGKLLGKEKDLRAKTERGEDADRLAKAQTQVAKETKDLENKIDAQDAAKNSGQGKPGEGKPGQGKPGEGKPGDKQARR